MLMKRFCLLAFICFSSFISGLETADSNSEENDTPHLMEEPKDEKEPHLIYKPLKEETLNEAEINRGVSGLIQPRKPQTLEEKEKLKQYIATVEKEKVYDPWFTGPLLAPSAHNIAPGLCNVQPYLFITDQYGQFDSSWRYHSVHNSLQVNPLVIIQTGITKFLDITGTFQLFYNQKEGQYSWEYGDTQLGLGLQLLLNYPRWYVPDMRLTITESFPTGNYQKLNIQKQGTDASGSGSFETIFSLNMQKTLHDVKLFSAFHLNPFSIRLSFAYAIPAPTDVKGSNTYGGGPGTRGRVKPGNIFTFIGSIEYSLTQQWVLASDFEFVDAQASTFSGTLGAGNSMGVGSSSQISMAPAIEYNVNENFGWIGGVWFSLWGRNSSDFVSGLISFTYTF